MEAVIHTLLPQYKTSVKPRFFRLSDGGRQNAGTSHSTMASKHSVIMHRVHGEIVMIHT